MKLHDWIYELVCDICHDREYVYASYIQNFGNLMKDIFEKGKVSPNGSYQIPGMKSDLNAVLNWELEKCVNLLGLNVVSINYCIKSSRTGKIESQGVRYFELSTGEETVGKPTR